MTTIPARVAFAAVLSMFAVSASAANNGDEATVDTTGLVIKSLPRTSTSLRPIEVSLSYRVSAEGLDLRSRPGVAELEKRVRGAAIAACRNISRQYPVASPGDPECVRDARDRAMVQVRALIASVRKPE